MRQVLAVAAVLISILLGLYFVTNNSSKLAVIQSPTPVQSPEMVVETYYSTYTNCLKNFYENIETRNGKTELEACPINLTNALSETYSQVILQQTRMYDPVLCAQDLPTSISVDPATITADGNTASTFVHERYETDNQVLVDLTLENNEWKITNITCNPKPNATEMACSSDDECVIYTCGCKGINKKYITPEMNVCMVVCQDMEPKCINNKCTTIKPIYQERVQ